MLKIMARSMNGSCVLTFPHLGGIFKTWMKIHSLKKVSFFFLPMRKKAADCLFHILLQHVCWCDILHKVSFCLSCYISVPVSQILSITVLQPKLGHIFQMILLGSGSGKEIVRLFLYSCYVFCLLLVGKGWKWKAKAISKGCQVGWMWIEWLDFIEIILKF